MANNKDDWEFCGLNPDHVREIIELVLNGRETNKKDIESTIYVLEPNVFNNYRGERLTINIPIKLGTQDKEFFKHGYLIHIYDNGHFVYENGMGVEVSYDNPLEIYKILVDNFKPVKK